MNNNLVEKLKSFISSLEDPNDQFHFYPVKNGTTEVGKQLKLGFSCYMMKIYFMLDMWKDLNQDKQNEWIKYINSFQSSNPRFPKNSFIDPALLNDLDSFDIQKSIKNTVKASLNYFGKKEYELNNQKINKTIIAETKQAISTLYMVESRNELPYTYFPKDDKSIEEHLNKFDWNYPWNAGAQFASLCVFTMTQLELDDKNKVKKYLEKFINNKVHLEDGLYYQDKKISSNELINGAMKVFTGFEWLGLEIHYPKKVIDFCLSNKPNYEGCDLVDIVYVLNRCSKFTNHKKNEIEEYFERIEKIIMKNFKDKDGGFSYFPNSSQTHYYGSKISNGLDVGDIHGTTLLIWALSLISDFRDDKNYFNVIKA